ncbi:winged helix-turn-helix domain-containing protein [Enterococcus sp. 669A]|uniref:Winged helix-turn-helix domain-containing protein n=1 Tax=Candidatus Enterococcus moelleringii TaxID=2815325 RepID=A0ABS3L801_9ENTE|nr:winged helix-turn-helix domain-containing protein [Enterococcus sp. 669A]MBO1305753.1 winged helix-turn-helix domain-containing protein [Enterococcus sp. 669A]
MQHALILTKNILPEESLVKKLQRMSYETLCSTDLLSRLAHPSTSAVLSYFQWVLLSESLCNHEVESILQQLTGYPLIMVRVTENYPNEEDQAFWKERGLSDWLEKDAGFEETREKLSALQQQRQQEIESGNRILSFPTGESAANGSTTLEDLYDRFSKTEKRVFEYLVKAYSEQGVSSRKELCEHLWREGDTPSNMSQLSCLINKLKRKCEMQGIQGEIVTTLWGRGYMLSDEFYQRWIQGSQMFDMQRYYSVNN